MERQHAGAVDITGARMVPLEAIRVNGLTHHLEDNGG